MSNPRPHYGNALEYERLLNIFFYTSNAAKLLQARLLFMRQGYELRHFSADREPYDEDYALGTELLLTRAIRQVNEKFGVRSIFFVEDTSVRIDCLSTELDFPGLAIKDWFASTSFESLEKELRRRGNDRRAKISSDIALYIPTLRQPLFFHGETSGEIAASSPSFEGSVQYPWLTPQTFNGWFIPNGATERLGAMEFEYSLGFDFRAKAIRAMLSRLEELNAALNLRSSFYTVRRSTRLSYGQLSLMPEEEKIVLLVIGQKCAGKTTLSDHVTSYDGVHVYEASTVLRGIAEQDDTTLLNADDALDFLRRKGWHVVASRIADHITKSDNRWSIVSGLRTIEELLYLKQHIPEARIIVIDADSRVRFERHIRRARERDIDTFEHFKHEDDKQQQFGALRVASEIADLTIKNDGSITQYHDKIDALFDGLTKPSRGFQTRKSRSTQLHRCLWALHQLQTPATCEEISAKSAETGVAVRIYNTNKVLKEAPEFAERIVRPDRLLQYRITSRGEQLLQLLDMVRGELGEGSKLQFKLV